MRVVILKGPRPVRPSRAPPHPSRMEEDGRLREEVAVIEVDVAAKGRSFGLLGPRGVL